MVEKPKRTGSPAVGCCHVRVARSVIAAFNAPLSGGAANNWPTTEKRRGRQSGVVDRRHELGAGEPPERCCRKRVAPPGSPTHHRAAVNADDLGKPGQTAVRGAVLKDGDQHDDGRDIDAAAEEAQRRGRLPRSASIVGTAEAEALIVLGAETTGPSARLARVSR